MPSPRGPQLNNRHNTTADASACLHHRRPTAIVDGMTHDAAAMKRRAALPCAWRKACVAAFVIAACGTAPSHAEDPLPVQEVAPGLFVHVGAIALMDATNEGGIANLGFVVGDDAVAVIDSGGSLRQGRRLLAAIRSRTEKPVRYVINTHMHPDHVFGNSAFSDTTTMIVGHRNLARALAARGEFYRDNFRRSMGDDLIAPSRIMTPQLPVENEQILDLGNRRLRVRAWPAAHTDNDLTVFDEATATLFAGDLVVVQHVPVLDGSLRGWLAVLGQLATLPAARVVPGHGPVGPMSEALPPVQRYLDVLAADLRRMIRDGIPIGAAAQKAARSESGHWQLFEEYNARNATAGFAELEWE
jgi:quinoprotein relay system zinc metallohydrolase 2